MQRKSGFTLIELVVIFSTIAVLSVIGLSVSIDYNRTQIVNTAYEEFKAALNTAKSRALSQSKPEGCTGTLVSSDVVIGNIINNRYTYELRLFCSGAPQYFIKAFYLPAGVTFEPYNPNYTISFPALKGGSSGGTVTIKGYNKVRTIEVDTAGNIK